MYFKRRISSGHACTGNLAMSGFTLVELAIVMVIIGILVGGTIKARALINDAKIKATIEQITAYSSALRTFKDTYKFTPGDMPAAQTILADCTAADGCYNGDGDGIVGTADYFYSAVDSAPTSENVQFWRHLLLADLMTGVTRGPHTQAIWGETNPASQLNGGYHAREGNGCGTCELGTMIVLRGTSDGTWSFDGEKATTPFIASVLDRKMDDGVALSGYVIGVSFGLTNGCGNASVSGQGTDGYKQNSNLNKCDVAVTIDKH